MALDEKFAEAWLNRPHTVFGFKLRPFSLWHKLLLAATGSPVMDADSEEVSPTDIYGAARICTLKYPACPKSFNSWSKLRIILSMRHTMREVAAFITYLEDYVTAPDFWTKESKSKKGSPPEELSCVVALMTIGMGEEEAWNTSVGKANWYTAAYADWQGADLDFVVPEEQNMEEMLKEKFANMPPPEPPSRSSTPPPPPMRV